jgi:hypothetical protein
MNFRDRAVCAWYLAPWNLRAHFRHAARDQAFLTACGLVAILGLYWAMTVAGHRFAMTYGTP